MTTANSELSWTQSDMVEGNKSVPLALSFLDTNGQDMVWKILNRRISTWTIEDELHLEMRQYSLTYEMDSGFPCISKMYPMQDFHFNNKFWKPIA